MLRGCGWAMMDLAADGRLTGGSCVKRRGSRAVQDVAGRGARARQPPGPDLRVDDRLSRKAQEIYAELDQLNTYHYEVDAKLRRLRSDVNLSGIFVRDYLLDVERERAPEYRAAA